MKVCSQGHINADSANFCKDCGERFTLTPRQSGGDNQVHGGQPYYPPNNVNQQYVNVQPPVVTNYNQGYAQPQYGYQQPSQRTKMTFGKAISTCFKKYADFKGRARRSEYWYFYLFYMLLFLPPYIMMVVGSTSRHLEEVAITGAVIVLLESLVFFLPTLAVFVRRMHDIGKSGWNWLWSMLPIIGSIVLLVFLCQEGDHNANEYGEPVM